MDMQNTMQNFYSHMPNIKKNMNNLLQFGAFSNNSPEMFEYDQFVYSSDYLKKIGWRQN